MTIRGVRKPGSVCVTSAARGVYQTNAAARAEERSGHRGPLNFIADVEAQQIPADTLADTGVRGVPAYRGEHNREVLRDWLEMDDASLAALEAANVLSARLPGAD